MADYSFEHAIRVQEYIALRNEVNGVYTSRWGALVAIFIGAGTIVSGGLAAKDNHGHLLLLIFPILVTGVVCMSASQLAKAYRAGGFLHRLEATMTFPTTGPVTAGVSSHGKHNDVLYWEHYLENKRVCPTWQFNWPPATAVLCENAYAFGRDAFLFLLPEVSVYMLGIHLASAQPDFDWLTIVMLVLGGAGIGTTAFIMLCGLLCMRPMLYDPFKNSPYQ
jgi:hypothetical protein